MPERHDRPAILAIAKAISAGVRQDRVELESCEIDKN
jgi:hypothetical protein